MNATLVSLALALTPVADSYPNPNILIEADALKSVDPKASVILDARDAKTYAAGHVPGAVSMPLADFSKAVPDTPEAWAGRLSKLGIKADTPVAPGDTIRIKERWF